MIYRIEATVRAPVHDTEVTDRVKDAVSNLVPEAELSAENGRIVGTTRSLDHFSELLHRQEILDTARNEFFRRQSGEYFSFSLKKQAAFQGVVNFAVGEEDELGEIDIEVRVDEPDVESYVDHVAPPTEGGRPVTDE
ncbi:RNA-binding domain-containing protein [Halalkalicoccus subterraneus]|uniref:RNA-binding domain-containing protein n=1 Tax=Halalkalicoccus subterraneus TaxID=2675002 RepID=UPI000EFA43B5|nr:RNA-binding domain-containing protein [Halalkalicoccus subterraneus]